MKRLVAYALVATTALACSSSDDGDDKKDPFPEQPIEGKKVEKTTEVGPVKATVSVVPAKPEVGDKIRLVLHVEAEAGVDVEMPPGSEALGRFRIVNYKERNGELAHGGHFYEQRLTMRPGGSGKQRIPRLRVEFVDNRNHPGRDAGVAKPQELLTDELVVEVQPVDPEGGVAAKLSGARGPLAAPTQSTLGWLWPWLLAVLVASVVGVTTALVLRRRDTQTKVSAYEQAMAGLQALQTRGPPGDDDADDWYVQLSAVVRRYLENRYRLRAPELTTEEFLREARHSAELSDEHRVLLSKFLVSCDRVKFAGYRPAPAESSALLDQARAFVEDTRLAEETAESPAPADRKAA